jgi:hypothetical protein
MSKIKRLRLMMVKRFKIKLMSKLIIKLLKLLKNKKRRKKKSQPKLQKLEMKVLKDPKILNKLLDLKSI